MCKKDRKYKVVKNVNFKPQYTKTFASTEMEVVVLAWNLEQVLFIVAPCTLIYV